MIDQTNTFSLIKKLYLKNRNFCSDDYDYCLNELLKIHPFHLHEFSHSTHYWQIPPKWDLLSARIYKDNQLIYDVDHPLKIIGLSKSVDQTVSLSELKKHLHYDHRHLEAIPYHFRQFYRPWERDWGFCVPRSFYESLEEGEYFVKIETKEAKGTLKVAELKLQGELDEGFTFLAHLDHPGMANDDLAGVAVGLELFKRLNEKKTKLSYSLIIVPEIIGSEFFLQSLSEKTKQGYLGACFLEMLATHTPLALQQSYEQNSIFEDFLLQTLVDHSIKHRLGPYKSIICNDETVWQSHGIASSSLSRFPYPEYHTSLDHPSILSLEKFEEAVSVLEKSICLLEKQTWIKKHFQGTPCTSHPDLNLYVDAGQPAFGTFSNFEKTQLRNGMDFLLAEKPLFLLKNISKRLDLAESHLISYLKKWEDKGLLTIY